MRLSIFFTTHLDVDNTANTMDAPNDDDEVMVIDYEDFNDDLYQSDGEIDQTENSDLARSSMIVEL